MINPVRPLEWKYYPELKSGMTMLELGNKKNGNTTYKSFFEKMGIKHTSIDWNGEDGALNRDLRTPLWNEFGQFDVVTNIGTSEHVDDQLMVWANIVKMCKVGGYIVCCTPAPMQDSWWWHGEHYPTEEFYKQLCNKNGLKLVRMEVNHPKPHTNIYCQMQKIEPTDCVFVPVGFIYKNEIRQR